MMGTTRARWFVVSTKARREQFAQQQLGRRGVESFLPRILEPARLRVQAAIAPLFPGYLFVHIVLDEQYCDVVWTPGVRKFVGFGALPCPVDTFQQSMLLEKPRRGEGKRLLRQKKRL